MLYATLQNLMKVPVMFLGFFIVPAMWPLRHTPFKDIPKWLLPWCNPEDWYGGFRQLPRNYNCVPHDIYNGKHGFLQFYHYHASRNGGDGLRNYDWHVCQYDQASMVLLQEDDDGYRIQQGKYGSMLKRIGPFLFKYGYRHTPRDVREGFNPRSFRWLYGAAPTWSLRRRNG